MHIHVGMMNDAPLFRLTYGWVVIVRITVLVTIKLRKFVCFHYQWFEGDKQQQRSFCNKYLNLHVYVHMCKVHCAKIVMKWEWDLLQESLLCFTH